MTLKNNTPEPGRERKPALKPIHLWILAGWWVLLVVAVIFAWRASDWHPWFPFAMFFYGAGGVIVLGAAALVARYAMRETRSRIAVLLLLPTLVYLWMFTPWLPPSDFLPANTYPTGLVIEVLPDGYSHSGEAYTQRGYFDIFNQIPGPDEMQIGKLDGDVDFALTESGSLGEMAYFVERLDGEIRLMTHIDGIRVEVSSKSLSVEEMALVAEGVRYDADWDLRPIADLP